MKISIDCSNFNIIVMLGITWLGVEKMTKWELSFKSWGKLTPKHVYAYLHNTETNKRIVVEDILTISWAKALDRDDYEKNISTGGYNDDPYKYINHIGEYCERFRNKNQAKQSAIKRFLEIANISDVLIEVNDVKRTEIIVKEKS